jgi:hypothetical protein
MTTVIYYTGAVVPATEQVRISNLYKCENTAHKYDVDGAN